MDSFENSDVNVSAAFAIKKIASKDTILTSLSNLTIRRTIPLDKTSSGSISTRSLEGQQAPKPIFVEYALLVAMEDTDEGALVADNGVGRTDKDEREVEVDWDRSFRWRRVNVSLLLSILCRLMLESAASLPEARFIVVGARVHTLRGDQNYKTPKLQEVLDLSIDQQPTTPHCTFSGDI